jgi:hypothetical protein
LERFALPWSCSALETGAVPYYRKKPVVIEAEQFNASNGEDISAWSGGAARPAIGHHEERVLLIDTLEGCLTASHGDWIIKGLKGEFYPCKPDIFEATYDLV